jgi:hypothetical protein
MVSHAYEPKEEEEEEEGWSICTVTVHRTTARHERASHSVARETREDDIIPTA